MKYTLKTNDTLKCSACGNKDFEEKTIEGKGGAQYSVYICKDCGHIMGFAEALKEKS